MDGQTLSIDLRKRVVAAVVSGGLSLQSGGRAVRGGASARRLDWVRAARETGSIAPSKIGGYRPKAISGDTATGCCSGPRRRLHAARAGRRTGRARPEGRLPFGVGVRSRREAQLQKKAWWLANAIVPTSHGGGRSGQDIKIASRLSAWSSSTRPGPGPTWRRCAVGRRVARGLAPRFRTAAGRP